MPDAQAFQKLADEIEAESGQRYDPEHLQDFEWCFREIGRLGYSVSITFLPERYFLKEWKALGRTPSKEDRESVKQGMFSYQLLGGKYTERGRHECPLTRTPIECITTALFNVCRIKAREGGSGDWRN